MKIIAYKPKPKLSKLKVGDEIIDAFLNEKYIVRGVDIRRKKVCISLYHHYYWPMEYFNIIDDII